MSDFINEEMREKFQKIRWVVGALLGTFSVFLSLEANSISDFSKEIGVSHCLTIFLRCLLESSGNIAPYSILIFVLFFILFKKSSQIHQKRLEINCMILSFFLAIIWILGDSYRLVNSWDLIFGNGYAFTKAVLIFCGYVMILFSVLKIVFNKLLVLEQHLTEKTENLKFDTLDRKNFLKKWVRMLLCWLPYFIICFPGTVFCDVDDQLHQFFGLTSDTYFQLGYDVTGQLINDQHPVFQTWMFGGFVEIGKLFGNENIGIFLFAVLQSLFMAAVLSFTLCYMKKIGVSDKICKISEWFYDLFILFPMYAMTMTNDTNFCIFNMILCLIMIEIVRTKGQCFSQKWFMIVLFFDGILIMLTKKQGKYIVLFAMFAMLFAARKYWKQILLPTLGALFVFSVLFTKLLLPALDVGPGRIRGALSMPFQQTARYIKEYPDDLTQSDLVVLSKVMNPDIVAEKYNPNFADPVKNTFQLKATKRELLDYILVWGKCFLKHPDSYIQAAFNLGYGYIYPGLIKSDMVYDTKIDLIFYEGEGLAFQNVKIFESARLFLDELGQLLTRIPVLSLFMSMGFMAWIHFSAISYTIVKKQFKRKIPVFIVVLTNILICMVSPVNALTRYAFYIYLCTPLIAGYTVMGDSHTKTLQNGD